jgi:hypothetical protein
MIKTMDFRLEYPLDSGINGTCRVRIYFGKFENKEEPNILGDPPIEELTPVVLITALPEDTGSIANYIEEIAAWIWRRLESPRHIIWIDHWAKGMDYKVNTHIIAFEQHNPFRNPRWTQVHPTQVEGLTGNTVNWRDPLAE